MARITLFLLAQMLVLIGCASSGPDGSVARRSVPVEELPVVAWFQDHDTVLSGVFVRSHHLFPRALELRGENAELRCVGAAPLARIPEGASPPEICDGMTGVSMLRCTDDRELQIGWITDPECHSGYGQGIDQDGNEIRLIFGGTDESVATATREALANLAGNPKLPAIGEGGPAGGGTGSGFFVSWNGHLVTNEHVVHGASRVYVVLEDDDLIPADVVQADEENDLALLRVDAIRKPLLVRERHTLERGTEILALGYPLVPLQGRDQKATFGHVNALSGLQGDERFTQIDAPIQPGNSGGPILSRDGEVVGVVTQMLSQTATLAAVGAIPQNVNYAIKSDLVHAMLRESLGDGWRAQSDRGDEAEWPELIDRVEDSVVMVVAEP